MSNMVPLSPAQAMSFVHQDPRAQIDHPWWPQGPSIDDNTNVTLSTEAISQRSASVAQAKSSVSVACIACRSKHLKCDGGVRCSRCQSEGLTCQYVKSRRGWRGPRKAKQAEQTATKTINWHSGNINGSQFSPSSVEFGHNDASSIDNNLTTSTAGTSPSIGNGVQLNRPRGQFQVTYVPPPQIPENNPPTNAKSAFFQYFWGTHPFLLPQNYLTELMRERPLPILQLAIEFLGSSYLPNEPTEVYRDALERSLFQGSPPRDGYTVQALLIYAIGLHAHDNSQRATQVLLVATSMALELGMHRRDFSVKNGHGSPILEESWRRTWWELFIVDGMFAGVNQSVSFPLRDVMTDVPLPCEEDEYISGNIPHQLRTLSDYDDSSFASEEIVFSSATYRIDAMRIMGRILAVSALDPNAPHAWHAVDVVDACLVNWQLHLPAEKKELTDRNGKVDEMLFQAFMIWSGSSILLHRPRSTLYFRDVEDIKKCVSQCQTLTPATDRNTHTAKAVRAAGDVSKLITLPTPLQNHTSFFTCMVVMASVVNLSYWSFIVPDGEDGLIKEHIRLNIGVLRTLSDLWPVASTVLKQVKGVAHEMLASKKAMSINYWNSIAGDEIQTLIEDAEVDDGMDGDASEYVQGVNA
ncbi:hypothetical protein M501DRAFT_1011261 [Patellaria atrata CBS 101060]|uniref:Zn(2)-C6 fungal-type domain-containing protein n=1 Tax=Patellaria atrata CBS 101060 TaxID=1346257 RepID=A0A9P4SCQ1_9PEZI|nr:hypothetical protein M501DRAFT_1011261 [Patellaria atrata CBS 101060]